jgi:hypothetical protein
MVPDRYPIAKGKSPVIAMINGVGKVDAWWAGHADRITSRKLRGAARVQFYGLSLRSRPNVAN